MDAKSFALKLYHDRTRAERILSDALRAAYMRGYGRRALRCRHREQVPLFGFIADFYFPDHCAVIELDGGAHQEQRAYDAARDARLSRHGIRTLRLHNGVVTDDPAWAAERCIDFATFAKPRPKLGRVRSKPRPEPHKKPSRWVSYADFSASRGGAR